MLTHAAEKLYALQDGEQAASVAQPGAGAATAGRAEAQRRVAWTVVAHTAFERGAFDQAESAYGEVLALLPAQDKAAQRPRRAPRRQSSTSRASARARPAMAREAVGHFARVAVVAPQSAVRATAQYDAAAALIGLKDWDGAARTLEDFRQRYPNHALQAEVGQQADAWPTSNSSSGPRPPPSSSVSPPAMQDPQVARASLWQAAELYDKGRLGAAAAKAYGSTWCVSRSRWSPPSKRAGAWRVSPRPRPNRRASSR